MDITPRPKLVVTIMKSMVHIGATAYTDSTVDPDDMFTDRMFVSECSRDDFQATQRRMALFLKETLLPVCIKTNALVFLHDNTCELSYNFGEIVESERTKRNGKQGI